MLLMGIMIVGVGVVFAIIEAAAGSDGDLNDFRRFSALAQGTEFLGEAFILAGISFILGSILGSHRGPAEAVTTNPDAAQTQRS